MPRTPKHTPGIAILLCTYNGGKFLRRQMDSFFSQTHENWELLVSDDGSTDDTREIVGEYADRGKKITVLPGPRAGASFNFLHSLRAPELNRELNAEYVAWSDQDDVWLPDKLARAVAALEKEKQEEREKTRGGAAVNDAPAVYSGRTELVDGEERHIALSPLFRKPPGFKNALCQNIGGGNTMVFNRAAYTLLCEGETPKVTAHDWWAYMLITGAGGKMLYDPLPTLRYRQHGGNVLGENRSIPAKLRRLHIILSGGYHEWNAGNVAALAARRRLLTEENAKIYDTFAAALREEDGMNRVRLLRQSGIYRQSALQDCLLRAAALLRKYP